MTELLELEPKLLQEPLLIARELELELGLEPEPELELEPELEPEQVDSSRKFFPRWTSCGSTSWGR
jgi:hypothetical protein